MLNLNHKNLDVWKLSRQFIKDIYLLTESFPKSEFYNLTNQLRRASVSILSNIAEGCSRKSLIERKRFFEISRSSLVEVDTQIQICMDLNYIKEGNIENLKSLANQIFSKLSNLITNAK